MNRRRNDNCYHLSSPCIGLNMNQFFLTDRSQVLETSCIKGNPIVFGLNPALLCKSMHPVFFDVRFGSVNSVTSYLAGIYDLGKLKCQVRKLKPLSKVAEFPDPKLQKN